MKKNKKIFLCVLACFSLVCCLFVIQPKKASAANADELGYIEVTQSYNGQSLQVLKEMSDEYDLPILFRDGDCLKVKFDDIEATGMFTLLTFAETMDCCFWFDEAYGLFLLDCGCELENAYDEHCYIYEKVSADNVGLFPTYSTYVYIVFNYDTLVYLDEYTEYFTIIPKENHLSDYDKGYNDGHYDGYNGGYDYGYEDGYEDGLENGCDDNHDEIFLDGYDDGYDDGYNDGVEIGENVNANFGEMILNIIDAPRVAITNILNFEFLGVNLANLVFFLISSALVVAIVKFFI